ncbi:hypothetical protein [Aestuariispira insulae]|nr:hypothetical protein [Aestuariispira insulae]
MNSLGAFLGITFLAGSALAQGADMPATSGASLDCGQASINYEKQGDLTKDEITAQMDAALFDSLNRYDACQEDFSKPEEPQDTAQDSTQDSSGNTAGEEASDAEGQQAASESAEAKGKNSSDAQGMEGSAAEQAANAVKNVASTPSSDMAGTETSDRSEEADPSAMEDSQQAASGGQGNHTVPSVAGDMAGTEQMPTVTVGNTTDGGSGDGEGAGQRQKVLANGKIPDDIPSADNDSVLEAQIRKAAEAETDPVVQKRLWNEYRKYKGLPQVN